MTSHQNTPKTCPEGLCDGKGNVWTDPEVCTCGVGPMGYFGRHEPGCGGEPCPAGCWQTPERDQAMRELLDKGYPVTQEWPVI